MLNSTGLRFLFLLTWLAALPLAGRAQQLSPLLSDPGRALYKPSPSNAEQRGQALALPFFDDFTRPLEGAPNALQWVPGGGAYVSNRFAFEPITRGSVLLDGLDANGQPYGTSGSGDLDMLTSQPIDLSSRTAADNIYVGFFWQAGNIFRGVSSNSSSFPVALRVEFKNSAGNWQTIWTWRTSTPNTRTAFRFKYLPVPVAYLHANFQFRFRAIGSLADNLDNWSIDYARVASLNPSTTAQLDTVFQDVATSKPLTSVLTRYSAMPVWQYNAAANPGSQLNPATFTTINNLSTGLPVPGQWTGTLQVRPAGPVAVFPTTSGFSLTSPQRQARVEGNLTATPIPLTADPKRIRHQIALTTNEIGINPLTLANDTIWRDSELSNYFAYDDGTAEADHSVPAFVAPTVPQYYALRFDLNQPDQVRSILIAPVLPSAANRQVTVGIWDADATGKPATNAPRVGQVVTFPDSLPPGQTFVEVTFPTPVAVTGRFYAGYGHGPSTAPPRIGADLNSAVPADAFWQRTQGFWEQVPAPTSAFFSSYALMLRPVLNNNVLAVAPAAVAADYALYPNPSQDGQVQVKGRYARATVLDALGRVAWQQPAAQLGQPTLNLQELPAGVYLVKLTRPDGLTVTKRLVLAK